MTIKVLHLLSNKEGIGGAEKFLLDMSGEYSDMYAVSYATVFSEDNNIYLDELRKRGLDCFEVKGSDWSDLPRIVRRLVEYIKQEKFDIVHTQLVHGSIVGQIAARLARVPVRIITRQYTTDCYHSGHRKLEKLDAYVARKATRVIAISEAVKADLLEQGVKPEKIDLVYNGIDLTPFDDSGEKSNIRNEFPDKFLIAFVANFNHRKGHEHLLRSMAQLVPEFPDIQLLLLGEGELKEGLEKLTSELDLTENISFLGYRSNVPAILKDVDLYVHASVLEPLGIAVLEAMAAGKCVVATAVGGVPEIIKDGETGFLVPPADPDAMAHAIKQARINHDLSCEIALSGQKRARDVFDIRSIATRYQEIYKKENSKAVAAKK